MSGNSLHQQDSHALGEPSPKTEDTPTPQLGNVLQGVIQKISPQGITVDIGFSQPGTVPPEDLEKLPADEREALYEGQQVVVYVTAVPEAGQEVVLSLYLARKERDWLAAEDLQRRDALWEGRVGGYNKGGLVVHFGHIRGFVPASQVTGITRGLSGENRLAQLGQFVGQQLGFKVIDVDRRRRRLILSERQGRTSQRSNHQEAVLTELSKGDIVRGRVRGLTDYGAFVDLGGMVGLAHRTELAWFRVEHPIEIVQEGKEVEALVLRVNRERGRVSLSIKRTYPDPWPTVMENYELGQLVEGEAIRQTGAGLFVMLADGILGFISHSDARQGDQFAEGPVIGQRVLARLVRIDGARRRLGLSLRRVQQAELEEWRRRTGEIPSEKTGAPGDQDEVGGPVDQPADEEEPAGAPVDQPPDDEAPAEGPVDQPPDDEAPAEAPVDQPPDDEAPAEAPVDQPPDEEAPAEAPVDQPADEEAPAEAPADQPPDEEAPAEAPVDQPPDEVEPEFQAFAT